MKYLHTRLAESQTRLARGRVWCRACGHSQTVDPADCLRHGWPNHCVVTMTIVSPEEKRALARRPWVPAEAELA